MLPLVQGWADYFESEAYAILIYGFLQLPVCNFHGGGTIDGEAAHSRGWHQQKWYCDKPVDTAAEVLRVANHNYKVVAMYARQWSIGYYLDLPNVEADECVFEYDFRGGGGMAKLKEQLDAEKEEKKR